MYWHRFRAPGCPDSSLSQKMILVQAKLHTSPRASGSYTSRKFAARQNASFRADQSRISQYQRRISQKGKRRVISGVTNGRRQNPCNNRHRRCLVGHPLL